MKHFDKGDVQGYRDEVRYGGRDIAYTVNQHKLVTDSMPPVLHIGGFLAKQKAYEKHARALTLNHQIPAITVEHTSGRPLAPPEIATFSKHIADRWQQAPVLLGHSLGGITTVLAIAEHKAAYSAAILMASAGFGGVRPHNFHKSLTEEDEKLLTVLETAAIAQDGMRYVIGAGIRMPALMLYAATKNVREQARGIKNIGGIVFTKDRLILSKIVKRSFSEDGIEYEEFSGSHLAQNNRPKDVAQSTAKVYNKLILPSHTFEDAA